MGFLVCFFVGVSILLAPSAVLGDGAETFRVYWKDGLRFETEDEDFRIRIGGRVMNDWAFFLSQAEAHERAVGELEDGVEIRRARIHFSGVIHDRVIFETEYELAGSDERAGRLEDAYVGLRKLPVLGTIKVGHQKEPFGLDYLTNSKYSTFMERGLPMRFAPGRNVGVLVESSLAGKRITWHAGLFRETGDDGRGQSDLGGYAGTVRVTALPWRRGDNVVHVGAAYRYLNPEEDAVEFDARPESHLAEEFVEVEDVAIEAAHLFGVEGALVLGSFSVQGEYVQPFVRTPGDFLYNGFKGYYVYGSWFVTGESRDYKRGSGKFGRVKPRSNFLGKDGGLGTLDVAVRYSRLDLDDEDGRRQGGTLADLTGGVNWYLNPNARVMFNYVFADLEEVGEAHIFQTRFQVDF